MKTIFKSIVAFGFLILMPCFPMFAQMAINITGSQAHKSAMLDITSTQKGLLIPRMTTAQRTSISNAAEGLLVYDTDMGAFFYFHSTSWIILLGSTGGWSLAGNSLTGTEFFGSTNNQPVKLYSNSIERMRISGSGKVGIGTTSPQWYLDIAGSMNIAQDSSYRINGNPVVSTKGTGTTLIGIDAGKVNTGIYNTATGTGALYSNTWGTCNLAIGPYALYKNMMGGYNIATGYYSLYYNTSGSDNTAVGLWTLINNTTGNYNTAIGYSADIASGGLSNATAIGNGAIAQSNNEMRLGNSAITSLFCKGALFDTAAPPNVCVDANGKIKRSNVTGGAFWSTSGNIGTNPPTHFIGTFDDKALVFKVNNVKSGLIDHANHSVSLGYEALFSNTGLNNTAIGGDALYNNASSGTDNVAVGGFTLGNNNSGIFNVAVGASALQQNANGNYNTGIGGWSLYTNSSGIQNTGIGYSSLYLNSTGYYNAANGAFAMRNNTTGYWNSAMGYASLYKNDAGYYNTANGAYAIYNNTSGSGNTASGYQSLYANTTGSYSTAIGYKALYSNSSGTSNIAVGYSGLYSNTTGSYNTAMGFQGLFSNTAGSYNTATGYQGLYSNASGTYNTAIGYNSLYTNNTGSYNTSVGGEALYSSTGDYNTAIGRAALEHNTSGTKNTANGSYALFSNATGNYNTADGFAALTSNTGSNNTGLGYQALYSNSTGWNNTAVGAYALQNNTTKSHLVAIGDSALFNNGTGAGSGQAIWNTAVGSKSVYTNTTGSNNTAIGDSTLYNSNANANTAVGSKALFTNTSGTGNTAIGYQADVASPSFSNSTAIGNKAVASSDNEMRLGNDAVTSLYCKGAYIGSSPDAPNLVVSSTGQIMRSNNAGGTGYYWSLAGNSLTGTELFGSTNNQPVKLYSNSIERMRISGSGNVGIGITAPLWYLDIAGSMNIARDSAYRINGNPVVSTKGEESTQIGIGAGQVNTSTANTAIGFNALNSNTIGYRNVANGAYALHDNTEGCENTANGTSALHQNNGSFNTANGCWTLYFNTAGHANTADGVYALYNNNEGYNNTAVGPYTLLNNITGNNNTAIGFNANVAADGLQNATAIGNQALATSDNEMRLGNDAVTSLYCKGAYLGSSPDAPNLVVNASGQIMRSTNPGGSGNYWSLSGNSITDPANFIGTTNPQSLFFKANDKLSGWIDVTESENCGFGYQTMISNTTGMGNSAFGYNALFSNQTGSVNSAFGDFALTNNNGAGNTAVGFMALESNLSGNGNSAFGLEALVNNNANNNTGFGAHALVNNSSGTFNTAIGYGADVVSPNPSNSTAIGNGAFATSSNEMRLGNDAVTSLYCKGAYNASSPDAPNLVVNSSGQIMRSTNPGGSGTYWSVAGNSITGSELFGSTNNQPVKFYSYNLERMRISGSGNVGIGITAPKWYLDIAGSMNIAFDSSYRINGSPVVSAKGEENTLIGIGAGQVNTSTANTAIGFNALNSNTTGFCNVANGAYALHDNTEGAENTANGTSALHQNNGSLNTANGFWTLYSNTEGVENTADGAFALYGNHEGNGNTAVGIFTLSSNITGDNNTAIGFNANVGADGLQNATAIGNQALATSDNEMRLGNDAVTSLYCKGAYNASSPDAPNLVVNSSGQIMRSTNPGGTGTYWSVAGNSITGSELFGSTNNQPVKFYSYNLERMRISATGNVGIGITAPRWYLDIAGSMNIARDSSYRINGSPVISTKGDGNTMIGIGAGKVNAGASNNSIGQNALSSNTTGSCNVANGYLALHDNTTGNENTAHGCEVLMHNTGSQNTADGSIALLNNLGGNGNTAIGYMTLWDNITGGYNTAVGYNANVAADGLQNATAIGNGAIATSNNQIRLGNDAVTSLYCKGVYNAPTTTNPANVVVYSNGQIMRTTNVTPQGANVGDMQYWNGTQWVLVPAGSNGQVLTFMNGVPTWAGSTFVCGTSIIVNHVAGAVAPVTKTTTYGTVNGIPGETSKCWITSNLGAEHQATAVSDATEASAGWYWQFNRKQGYKLADDGTTRTPPTSWINNIDETSAWITANDPCNIELGAPWRIPTYTEWNNVNTTGGWTNWNGPWGSGLKLHAAGYLNGNDGLLYTRGSNGRYWSSTQNDPSIGLDLLFNSGYSLMDIPLKAYGLSVRCVRDY